MMGFAALNPSYDLTKQFGTRPTSLPANAAPPLPAALNKVPTNWMRW
jgi:hypothetical protein